MPADTKQALPNPTPIVKLNLTACRAIRAFNVEMVRLLCSPAIRTPELEARWIDMLWGVEQSTEGAVQETTRCIREHALLVKNERLKLIRDAKELVK